MKTDHPQPIPHEVMLIHGGNGAPFTMAPLKQALGVRDSVWCPTLAGHGGRGEVHHAASLPAMVDDLLVQMDERGTERCFIGGHCFGGYLALYLARHHADRCLGVFTLGTQVVHDARTVVKLMDLYSPERFEAFGQDFVDLVAQVHLPHDWRAVLRANQSRVMAMAEAPALVASDWPQIRVPALLAAGQADELVPVNETQVLAAHLKAKLVLFAGTAHPLHKVPVQGFARELSSWMDQVRDGNWPPR